MKKITIMVFLTIMWCTGAAQNSQELVTLRPQEVIQKIPSLLALQNKIQKFESKVDGRKENYKNANSDLKALKTKYATELTVQINALKDDKEAVNVLKEELEKTNKEITNLK